jgi:hypothetical protein
MKGTGFVKAAALAVVLLAAGMVGGMPFHWDVPPPLKGEPWPGWAGLIVVAVIGAVILTLLAERSTARGWKLGLVLGIVLFAVESGLSEIEAVAFNNDLKIPFSLIVNGTLSSLIRDVMAGIAVALLWRTGETAEAPRLRGPWWKLPAIAVLYFACYFAAGLWAYAQPVNHAFYVHGPQISLAFLAELELGRGLIWSALAALMACYLRGPAWSAALLTGVTFSVLMAAQLLLPNPFMPWPLRCVHIVEIGVSNLVFGFLASLIWLSGSTARSSADRP